MVRNARGRPGSAGAAIVCLLLSACSWLVDVDDLGGSSEAPDAAGAAPDSDATAASPPDARGDSDGDGVGPDGGTSGLGGDGTDEDAVAPTDASAADATAAEAAADGGDASPLDSPASEADGGADVGATSGADSGDASCATSFADAGGLLLFSFDDASSAVGWSTSTAGGVTATAGWQGAAGHTCPGEMQMTVQFQGSAAVSPDIEFAFNPSTAWNRSKIHVWLKLQVNGSPLGFAALKAAQLFVQSNAFANYTSIQMDVGSTLSDGAWHELVMNLVGAQNGRSGPDVVTTAVDKIGVVVIPSRADAGFPPPPTTTLSLDDIWLE